jgi:hypothetical protein
MDWKLLGAIARDPKALVLLVVCAVSAGAALTTGSLTMQIVGSIVAVGAFCGAIRVVRRT